MRAPVSVVVVLAACTAKSGDSGGRVDSGIDRVEQAACDAAMAGEGLPMTAADGPDSTAPTVSAGTPARVALTIGATGYVRLGETLPSVLRVGFAGQATGLIVGATPEPLPAPVPSPLCPESIPEVYALPAPADGAPLFLKLGPASAQQVWLSLEPAGA
jgi:hypothetical protein